MPDLRKTLWIDGFMRRSIIIGGIGCLGIFVFLFLYLFFQVKPLLDSSDWEIQQIVELEYDENVILWEPRLLDGSILMVKAEGLAFVSIDRIDTDSKILRNLVAPDQTITAARFDPVGEILWLGASSGELISLRLQGDVVAGEFGLEVAHRIKLGDGVIDHIDSRTFLDQTRALVSMESSDGKQVFVLSKPRADSPFELDENSDEWEIERLTEEGFGELNQVMLSGNHRVVAVVSAENELLLYTKRGRAWDNVFKETLGVGNASPNPQFWVGFGGSGKYLVSRVGAGASLQSRRISDLIEMDEYSAGSVVVLDERERLSLWKQDHRTPVSVVAVGSEISVLNLSLQRSLGRFDIAERVKDFVVDLENEKIWVLGEDNRIRILRFQVDHLDYYVGESLASDDYDFRQNTWQPAVSSPQVQPGYSLYPMIVGTLKGTLLALSFATPLAVFSAIYTSQFARFGFRKWIKPAIELLGSLPSVVLGFLCVFWLGPYIEAFFSEMVSFFVILPLTILALMRLPFNLPGRISFRVSALKDLCVSIAVLAFCGLLSLIVGSVVDALFSSNPVVAKIGGDGFLDWLELVMGIRYEQRNAVSVAIILGFATVPFMYSLMEDAFALVPRSQVLTAMSLGASRLQMVLKVLLPAAAPGIFGALLVSASRCLGETMIFVMVSGNAPIDSLGLFEGFKTLSATLAIELPEARVGSTLYRTLFLAAWVLLCLTFIANTSAALLRRYYERKYRYLVKVG